MKPLHIPDIIDSINSQDESYQYIINDFDPSNLLFDQSENFRVDVYFYLKSQKSHQTP